MSLLAQLQKFNAAQQRVPKGSPNGGQWITAGNYDSYYATSKPFTGWSTDEAALHYYMAEGYTLVNNALRSGEPLRPQLGGVNYTVESLDRLFAKAPPLEKPIRVYRGVKHNGQPGVEPGYLSTSRFPGAASNFAREDKSQQLTGTVMTIEVPAGMKALFPKHTEEGEVLLPRGLTLRYLGTKLVDVGDKKVIGPYVEVAQDVAKFNTDQPRAPKGSPDGGQWTAQGALNLPSSAYPIAQAHPETLNRYRRADGTFTPERQRLHDAIIASYFTAATPVKRPETVVIGGGPASGKSTALKAILQRKNFIHVDADDIKQILPEFNEGVKAGDDTIGTKVHEESTLIQKAVVARATAEGYNLIIDGTGDHSYDRLAQKVTSYRTPGRKISAYYTTVDIEEAIRRAHERGKGSGRFVPEEYNREAHRNVSSVFATALQNRLFDEANLFDTNGPAPVKIAEAKGAKVTVLDVPAWQRFLAKAQTNELAQAPFAFGAPSRIHPNELRDYLAAYGQEWQAAPLPADVERGKMGNCYRNATHAVLDHPDWRYAEGYAYTSKVPLPILHGWAVKPDGTVADPTWTDAGARYFGVAYDREAYLAHIVKTKMYGVLGGKAKDAEQVIKTGGAHLRRGKKGVLP